MNLRKEVTTVMRDAGKPVGPSYVVHELRRRGARVREGTVINHMRTRAKMDAGADLIREPTGLYRLRGGA